MIFTTLIVPSSVEIVLRLKFLVPGLIFETIIFTHFCPAVLERVPIISCFSLHLSFLPN